MDGPKDDGKKIDNIHRKKLEAPATPSGEIKQKFEEAKKNIRKG